MKITKILKVVSLLILLITLISWIFTGASTGWTKTSVSTLEIDEITGLEYPVHKEALVIGLELLALGIALSASVFTISIFTKPKQQ
jgi:hypothetical protein